MGIIKKPNKVDKSKTTVGEKIKNVFLDLGADLGLTKSPRAQVRDQQQLISDIIAEGKRLRNRLQTIVYKSPTIPKEQLIEDQRKIAVLIVKLDDVIMADMPDTREIDKVLYKLCDQLQDAYQKGDTLTAHYIIETLIYGIANGHKPLLETEKDSEEEVMAWREKKLNTYLKITQTAYNVFQYGAAVEANTKKLKEDRELLKKQLKEIEDFKHDSEHPENAHAMEEIQKADGRMDKLTGPAFALAGMMKTSIHTFKECELLRKQISAHKVSMYNDKGLISKMEINLTEPNIKAKEEILAFVMDENKKVMQRMKDQIKGIMDTDAVLTDYANSIEAAFNSPKVGDYIIGALNEFDEMMYSVEEDRAAYGRAMEREKQKKQDVESEQSIFN